ncbi:hypothetical protein [Lentzea sp. NPDC059081]
MSHQDVEAELLQQPRVRDCVVVEVPMESSPDVLVAYLERKK